MRKLSNVGTTAKIMPTTTLSAAVALASAIATGDCIVPFDESSTLRKRINHLKDKFANSADHLSRFIETLKKLVLRFTLNGRPAQNIFERRSELLH